MGVLVRLAFAGVRCFVGAAGFGVGLTGLVQGDQRAGDGDQGGGCGEQPARVRGRHFPSDQAALKCLSLVTRSLDPTGTGRARWMVRWKPVIDAFATQSPPLGLPAGGIWQDLMASRSVTGRGGGMSELRHDIEQAKQRMRVKFGGGREIKKLVEYLWEGEYVEAMTAGAYGKGLGLLVLTDRRLLFVMDGWTGKTSEDFPIDKISSVQWSSGMATGKIIVFASGNKAEIKNVNKDDGNDITDRIRHRLSDRSPASAPVAAPAPAGASDPYEQLRRLGELREAGVLTPQEFEDQKAVLLRRL